MTTMPNETTDEIPVASLPPIDGLRFRRYGGPHDVPGMASANLAARRAYGIREGINLESMRNQYANLSNSDLREDVLVIEVAGRIVGYGRVEVGDQTDGSMAIDSIGILQPDLRGRGIGSAMLDWMESRARALAPSMPMDRPRWMSIFNWDADAFAARLFEKRGYRPVRTFFEMVRPTLADIPDAPLPAGIHVRPVGPDDLRAIWEANAEIFRDEWGGHDTSEAAWRRFSTDPALDPSLLVVAFSGDEVAAVVTNSLEADAGAAPGTRLGNLDSVGTRRPYRQLGLARALICRSLVILRDRGMDGASLGVDADNPNKALHLYESCGFVVQSRSTAWQRPLDDLLESTP